MRNKLISSLVGAAFSFAASGAAFSADMAVKMPVKAPPPLPAPIYSWTGFYVGGNVGYSWGRSSTNATLVDSLSGTNTQSQTLKANGVLGGLQAGYNWQSSIWVLGGEADIQATGQRGSGTFLCTDPFQQCGLKVGSVTHFTLNPVTTDITQKLPWFGTVRGRLGATLTPTVLAMSRAGWLTAMSKPM